MSILEELKDVIIQGEKDKIGILIDTAIREGIPWRDILKKGMSIGLQIVGKKFEKMEMFLPEMILSADTMKAGVDKLMPHVQSKEGHGIEKEGTIVIGTVKGDIHDIGKNIVKTFLELNGFDVYDLGFDVDTDKFVEAAEEKGADIIGLSALMTTTMIYMKDIIEELEDSGLREKYMVMAGGPTITPGWIEEIGADGFGKDFMEAVKVAKNLMKSKKER